MTAQITIIGLGQIGASIGLALEAYKKDIYRVGHDKDLAVAKEAQKLGAIDKIHRNLPNSVRDADIIILSLPFGEIYDTLKYIVNDVKEDALILDTGLGKVAVYQWVQELFPEGRSYIGLGPVINAEYLHEEGFGIDAARKDLFENTPTMIAAPTTASGGAVDAAVTLAQLIGSQPLFTDIYETDGVMTSAHLMPQLIAAILTNTTVGSSGWGEAKKIAGRAFAEGTRPIIHQDGGGVSLAAAAFANRQALGFKLDEVISSLQEVKSILATENQEALQEIFGTAYEARDAWMIEREAAKWLIAGEGQGENLRMGSMTAQLFGFKDRSLKD
jgi:prephenate dehydrogenase